jgi:hypothetical protein
MEERSLKYEQRFRKYLFKGSGERFKQICKDIGIKANINLLKESKRE